MLCFLHFHQAHCKTSNKEQRNGSTRGCQLLPSLLQMVFCSCRNYWQLLFSMVFPPGSGSPAVSSQYPAIIWQWLCSCSAWWEAVHLADAVLECVIFVSSSRRKRLHIFWLQTYSILCASSVLHSYFEVTFNVCWCQQYSTEVLRFYENVLQATSTVQEGSKSELKKNLSFCRSISGCQPPDAYLGIIRSTASSYASHLKMERFLDTASPCASSLKIEELPDTGSSCASSLKIKQLLDASELQLQLVWPIACWWRRRQCDWTFPGC